jgi:D-3-phosphoglycerate dehydrogenase
LRSGEWRKKDYLECPGLRGRTLGVFGAGQIARRVIRVAQAMGMRIVCLAPELDEALAAELGVEKVTDKLELARQAAAVSVHIPFLPETHHFFSIDFFNALPIGAIFVNTSRGAVVDTPAMIEAIRTRKLRVGLDVFEQEPTAGTGPFEDSELAKLLVSCTCHIGGSTEQASDAVAIETLNVIRTFIRTGEALHCVNLEARRKTNLLIAIRHKGVLTEILALITAGGAEVVSVNNQSLMGGAGETATLRIRGHVSIQTDLQALAGVTSLSVTSE